MKKAFFIDTNILIDDPNCIEILRNGEENLVLIPYSVIMELDRLKVRSDLSHIVSKISDILEKDEDIKIIKDPEKKYSREDNDDDILHDIKYAIDRAESCMIGYQPWVISNDKIFRIRAKFEGFNTQDFRSSKPFESESQYYTGIYSEEYKEELLHNSFQWQSGHLWYQGQNKFIDYDNDPWGVKPRTVYQNATMTLMLDKKIDVVTVQSEAGYGKTHIALAAAFQLALQKPKKFKKIWVFKPIVEIGEKMGFLPGDVDDKIAPYARGIKDLIIKIHHERPANALFIDPVASKLELDPKVIEIDSINFIRGMNLENSIVIIDEGQNLTRYQMRALLSRMGENVRCFILGDTNQVDHPYLNSSNNGLNWVVKKFKDQENYGHMVLKGAKSRGPICDLVLKTGL